MTELRALDLSASGRWLSVQEVASYLGVSRDTLYKWIRRKDVPVHKVGRLWKFKLDEVDAWVRSGAKVDRRRVS